MASEDEDMARRKAIAEYLEKKRQHELLSLQVRGVREALRNKKKDYAKTKDDLKSCQSVGQSSGEVPRPQGSNPCKEAPRSKKKDRAKTKDDLKSLQSIGQSTEEVIRPQCNKQLTKKLQKTKNDHAKTEDDLKSLQITGESTGEAQRPLGNEPCGAETQGGEETEGGQEARVKSSLQC